MVRFYWYGLTVIYFACSLLGVLVGAAWGVGGMILGLATGATLAAGVALMLDKSEGRENAFYGVLSVLFIVVIAWFVALFGVDWP